MIFKPHLLDLIIAGRKRQTRRPAYEGEVARDVRGQSAAITWGSLDPELSELSEIITRAGRTRFKVGKSVAAQPGRGKPAPMVASLRAADHYVRKIVTEDDGPFMWANASQFRIVIDKIRFEDCRTISDADVIAEGFKTRAEFLAVWCGFYDRKALYLHDQIGELTVFDIIDKWHGLARAEYLNDWANAVQKKRPAEPYMCWALTIRPER